MTRINGHRVTLRTADESDVDALVAIRATPAVRARWRGDDLNAEVRDAIQDDQLHVLVVEDAAGSVIGAIQWDSSDDPDYRYASVDLFLHPGVHGRGLGADAARTLCRHLIAVEGFHRITIDPAADNLPAIRCYEKVGFRTVGVLRRYERGADGTWHDGVLMELLDDELLPEPEGDRG